MGTTKVAAIFAGDGSVRVRVGGSTPDLPAATLAKLGAPSGDAALASLKPLPGVVTAKDDTVLLAGLTSGPVRIAAREGFAHNGLTGGITLKTIGAFDGTGGAGTPIFFLATLQGGDVTSKSDSALCVALANGDVHVLVREGKTMVGGQGVIGIASLIGVKGSLAEGRWRAGASAIGARLTLEDKSQGLFTIPSSATAPAQWTVWVNSAATLGAPLAGAKFASLGMPGFGDTGPAIMAKLKAAPPTFTAANDTTLLRDEAAGLVLLGRESETAPVGGSFAAFSDPVSGASGRTAFLGTAAYGTPAKKLAALWYSADGDALILLTRVGDNAAGGGKWAAFNSCVLPDASGPLFTATLATDKAAGISASNNFGLWGANAAGTVRQILRTGDRVMVSAVERTVKSFVALTPAAGSIGAAHGYDETGRTAVLATFTDKTVALLELAAP